MPRWKWRRRQVKPADVVRTTAYGVAAIGYANKPGKRERLAAADVVIDSMADLVTAFAVNEL